METARLKSFAIWARTELIKEVGARIAAVLASGSSGRVEEPAAIKALERAIAAGGGGADGRAKVADKVAYTWFNRVIALRFMDANGYTGIGVVSPPRGETVGQPEVLADAKRGVIDAEVVGRRAAEAVTAVLDGTRRSTDPHGEAFNVLLTEYCRYWHRSMPFMFEREGDYTELLIPANLLADGSVLARAVAVLTDEVCRDVEVIGWLYQFYIADRKDAVFAGFKKNQKAGADEIPAATQLFTPHWIVRYLVENSLGRLWMLNHPGSRLVDQMDYYIAPAVVETDLLRLARPEELTVVDPACGSGHMLTYAFDLLYAIYEEQGYAPSEIPGRILTHNLYGTEIDPRAGALAAFALTMKARARQRTFFNKQIEPNICLLDPISFSPDELDFLVTRDGDRHVEEAFWNQFAEADTLGSLIQPNPGLTARLARHLAVLDSGDDILRAETHDRAQRVVAQAEYLVPHYTAVVANPPYMGSGNMNAALAVRLKSEYPTTRFDLMTAFMERADKLCVPGGVIAMINLPSWMFLTSFAQMRFELLRRSRISSLLHLGRGVFGSDFGSVAFVFDKAFPTPKTEGVYRRLFDAHVEVRSNLVIEARFRNRASGQYVIRQSELESLPGTPIAYWLSEAMRKTFVDGTRLGGLYSAMNGMTTGENARFLRLWHEVSWSKLSLTSTDAATAVASGAKWFPYNKGGPYRKWYGNAEHVIDWEADGRNVIGYGRAFTRGRKYYFKPMVSWGKVSSGLPSFRLYPAGFLFDVAGTSMFAQNTDDLFEALAFCNSTVAEKLLAALSPTLNYESGQISSLPVIRDPSHRVVQIARRMESIARGDWNSTETAWGFRHPALLSSRSREVALEDVVSVVASREQHLTTEARLLEEENNSLLIDLYGLVDEAEAAVELGRVSLNANPVYRFGAGRSSAEYVELVSRTHVADLVSFAVGCMFGRYSIDDQGLILADQGATLQDYLAKIPNPTFMPDKDDVIPIVDGDWFEDDIVERFRRFLRAAFGEQHFERNLRFVERSLSVENIRTYFVRSFHKDHVQRYKKRPIYWLFSSPKGSFNALIYMHRYTPSTVSTVLNEYLREFQAKLQASLSREERSNNPREADRLRKVLVELDEYEHDVLYPLATQQIAIDLDDGVKANYPKFGAALRKIPGLEASDE